MQVAKNIVRRLDRPTLRSAHRRWMSSGHSEEENLKEMNKWRLVTYAAVPICIGTAIYDLSGSHGHHHDAPEYSYLHIRSKEFPWGDCALFDGACWKQKALEAQGEGGDGEE